MGHPRTISSNILLKSLSLLLIFLQEDLPSPHLEITAKTKRGREEQYILLLLPCPSRLLSNLQSFTSVHWSASPSSRTSAKGQRQRASQVTHVAKYHPDQKAMDKTQLFPCHSDPRRV